ncbi:DUF305 domain-containing protein [Streptomycetaceae bacterium NBC_01309]
MLRGLVVTTALFVTGAGMALTAVAFSGDSAAPPLPAAATAAPSDAAPPPTTAAANAPGTGTAPGTGASPKPPNAADLAFALAMVPHHAQAVEMSRLLLAKPDAHHLVTALAERIRTDQEREIGEMNAWLSAWGQDPVPADSRAAADHATHHGGTGGMLTPAQMAALAAADGPTASRLFLDLMTEHHEGAVAMAQAEAADGANVYTRNLARHIITEQQTEILQMSTLATHL